MFLASLLILLIVGTMIIALAVKSLPAMRQFGLHFLIARQWNPAASQFGALPFIYGTIASSAIALLISVPLALGIGLGAQMQQPLAVAVIGGFLAGLPLLLLVLPSLMRLLYKSNK